LHIHSGTFKGLKKAKEKKIVGTDGMGYLVGRETGKYRKNFWEIKEVEWEGWSDKDSEGTGFGVCEEKDENGNPFLKFEWGDISSGGCHGAPDVGFCLGKKVRKPSGLEWELTEDEQNRLGMLWSCDDIGGLEKKGYISGSEGSNEESGEDSESDEAEVEAGLKRGRTDEKQETSSSKSE
jgi:hypothetical protein